MSHYALARITATRESLAEGKGRIKERLLDAYLSQGMRIPALDGGDDDPELANEITQFHADMTRRSSGR